MSNFSIRVGKVLIPFGIYNEIRDVNILLPFYRAPVYPYGEGNYIAETLDGMSLNYRIETYAPWNIDLSFYYGQMQWVDWEIFPDLFGGDDINVSVEKSKVNNTIGFQFWLETGMKGLDLESQV